MQKLVLISHHLCPYVQRAAIAMAEKGVSFERVYVDLSDKPEWFSAISPLGKVPLLKVQKGEEETVIFESNVILEYLEETEISPLHPLNALERARHRAWMEFGSQILNRIWNFYTAKDDENLTAQARLLHDMFTRVEDKLIESPFFAGVKFSLVDAVFGPVFRYFDVFDQIGEFGVFDGLEKTQAWRNVLNQRDSIKHAVTSDYNERLLRFLKNRGSALSQRIEA